MHPLLLTWAFCCPHPEGVAHSAVPANRGVHTYERCASSPCRQLLGKPRPRPPNPPKPADLSRQHPLPALSRPRPHRPAVCRADIVLMHGWCTHARLVHYACREPCLPLAQPMAHKLSPICLLACPFPSAPPHPHPAPQSCPPRHPRCPCPPPSPHIPRCSAPWPARPPAPAPAPGPAGPTSPTRTACGMVPALTQADTDTGHTCSLGLGRHADMGRTQQQRTCGYADGASSTRACEPTHT